MLKGEIYKSFRLQEDNNYIEQAAKEKADQFGVDGVEEPHVALSVSPQSSSGINLDEFATTTLTPPDKTNDPSSNINSLADPSLEQTSLSSADEMSSEISRMPYHTLRPSTYEDASSSRFVTAPRSRHGSSLSQVSSGQAGSHEPRDDSPTANYQRKVREARETQRRDAMYMEPLDYDYCDLAADSFDMLAFIPPTRSYMLCYGNSPRTQKVPQQTAPYSISTYSDEGENTTLSSIFSDAGESYYSESAHSINPETSRLPVVLAGKSSEQALASDRKNLA